MGAVTRPNFSTRLHNQACVHSSHHDWVTMVWVTTRGEQILRAGQSTLIRLVLNDQAQAAAVQTHWGQPGVGGPYVADFAW